jgi:hypothetical protein
MASPIVLVPKKRFIVIKDFSFSFGFYTKPFISKIIKGFTIKKTSVYLFTF